MRQNPYETQYGVIFVPDYLDVYMLTGDYAGQLNPVRYETFLNPIYTETGDSSFLHHWQLYPIGRCEVDPPSVDIQLLDVPGADVPLDLTETLTGRPLYSTRPAKWKFITVQPRSKWDSIYSEILNTLHGHRFKVVRMEEPDYYYVGRIEITSTDSDKYNGQVAIKGTFEAFKYSVLKTDDDWLWDPFSFEDGIVYYNPNDYSVGFSLPEVYTITLPIGTPKTVLFGAEVAAPTSPVFIIDNAGGATVTLTVGSATATLHEGENPVPGLYFSKDQLKSISFLATGGSLNDIAIRVSYRRTSL